MKKIQIWEVKLNLGINDKKYVEATGFDDALARAREWTQEEFDRQKKKDNALTQEEFAEEYDIIGVQLYVETDV